MNSEDREKRIIRTSILGLIVNLCIAAAKIFIGMAVSSLAIVSEGMNNATDAGSSFLTLAGTKLASKHPDKDHPFGYGRIEYLTSLTVAILILYAGISLLITSVKGIMNPGKMEVSMVAVALVAGSAVIKFFLGNYVIKQGKITESSALMAVGIEGRNDSFFSILTIAVTFVYITTGISIDAWVGAVFSLVIIKAGWDTLMETVSELIGRPGKAELAKKLYKEIRSTKEILNVADMMLHNYGPDNYSGSVNIEIDYKENIGDIYEFLHELQLKIMHEYNVTMVFGIYAVDEDRKKSREMRSYIGKFVKATEHVSSFHALYLSEKTRKIYCDLVVDYDLRDWEELRSRFTDYMKNAYPENDVELTIETDFV